MHILLPGLIQYNSHIVIYVGSFKNNQRFVEKITQQVYSQRGDRQKTVVAG